MVVATTRVRNEKPTDDDYGQVDTSCLGNGDLHHYHHICGSIPGHTETVPLPTETTEQTMRCVDHNNNSTHANLCCFVEMDVQQHSLHIRIYSCLVGACYCDSHKLYSVPFGETTMS